MNIILFSRKQVNHNSQQLLTLMSTIERLGLNFTINEDFALVVEQLTDLRIAPQHIFSEHIRATGDDVMITYGGDGTLLEAVGLLPDFNIPVVGVNSAWCSFPIPILR